MFWGSVPMGSLPEIKFYVLGKPYPYTLRSTIGIMVENCLNLAFNWVLGPGVHPMCFHDDKILINDTFSRNKLQANP